MNTSQEIEQSSYVQEKRSFPHYDLPLNSFTPADHHAASHSAARNDKTGKTEKNQISCEVTMIYIRTVYEKNTETSVVLKPHAAVK